MRALTILLRGPVPITWKQASQRDRLRWRPSLSLVDPCLLLHRAKELWLRCISWAHFVVVSSMFGSTIGGPNEVFLERFTLGSRAAYHTPILRPLNKKRDQRCCLSVECLFFPARDSHGSYDWPYEYCEQVLHVVIITEAVPWCWNLCV